MARLTIVVLLLANAALAAWLWHDLNRPEPGFASREKDADAIRVAAVVPPSEGAARAAAREGRAGSLSSAPCIRLTGLSAEEQPGVRNAVASLALGDRVQETTGPAGATTLVFRNPDDALLAWLSRLQRGLDDARLETSDCPPAPSGAPVVPAPPPGGRR